MSVTNSLRSSLLQTYILLKLVCLIFLNELFLTTFYLFFERRLHFKPNIMMTSFKTSTSSTAMFVAIVLALIMVASAASPCDENGQCKYGGVCGDDGMCSCAFSCQYDLWGRNLYCGHGRVKVYRNLCQLVSHACELQRDIPMIPIKYKRDFMKTCRGEKAPPTKMLCGESDDFINRCNTRNSIKSQTTGGICIQDFEVDQHYCKCPANRAGQYCEKWVASGRAVVNLEPTKSHVISSEDAAENIRVLNIEIIILSASVVFFVVCLIAVILRYKKLIRNSDSNNVSVADEKTRFCTQSQKTYRSSLLELFPQTICPKRDSKVELDTKTEKVNSAFSPEN